MDKAKNGCMVASETSRMILQLSIACNSSASLGDMEKVKDPKTGMMTVKSKPTGNKTEIALLQFIHKVPGCDIEKFRTNYLEGTDQPMMRLPFTSKRKRMTTEVNWQPKDGPGAGKNVILMKGASEIVLDCCSHVLEWNNDTLKPLDATLKAEIVTAITGMAKETLRTLCLAYKFADGSEKPENRGESDKFGVYPMENSGFTLLCVTGIRDILRPTVKDSVRRCQIAGIRVRMVTGDNQVTAEAIAKDCGIIKDHKLWAVDPQVSHSPPFNRQTNKEEATGDNPNYKTDEHVMLGKDFWALIGGVVQSTAPSPNP
jgi:magnesium-transporting ATPase (P-type)